MTTLLYLLICIMILTCVAGGGLALGLVLPRPWIAMLLAPWIITTFFFAVESIIPLGRGGIFIGIVFTLVSGWLLAESQGGTSLLRRYISQERWRRWREAFVLYTHASRGPGGPLPLRNKIHIESFGGILLVLVFTFAYAMAWRYTFPLVDSSSEKIPDLSYITSYLAGDGVPAKDYWNAPFTSIQYYSFQHYAASLVGRAFQMEPGLTYNIAFCLVVALTSTCGIAAISTLTQKLWVRGLCSACLLWGGSGMSGIIHLLCSNVSLWTSMRFIGSVVCDKAPLGTWFNDYAKKFPQLQLPGEPLAYSIYLGDYHAPLAGLYLLFLAILLLGDYHVRATHGQPEKREQWMVLAAAAATLPWCLVANTWSMPLQGLLLGGWMGHQIFARQMTSREFFALMGGGIVTLLALLPYVALFFPATRDYNTAMRWVSYEDHTPPVLLFLFLLPVVVLVLLGLCSRQRTIIWVALFWYVIFIFTECVYIDDIYSGQFERFNTTLKWWPWMSAGVTCSLAPLILSRVKKWPMLALAILVTAYPCLFAWDLAHYWWTCPKPDVGMLTGDSYLKSDPSTRVLYNQLKQLPLGLTVERPEGEAFTNTTALSLMAGKPCWLGWLGHEQLWRGYSPELAEKYQKLMDLYNGTSTDVSWLASNHVRYILWYKPADTEVLRLKLNDMLKEHYHWVETYKDNDRSTGYWELNS